MKRHTVAGVGDILSSLYTTFTTTPRRHLDPIATTTIADPPLLHTLLTPHNLSLAHFPELFPPPPPPPRLEHDLAALSTLLASEIDAFASSPAWKSRIVVDSPTSPPPWTPSPATLLRLADSYWVWSPEESAYVAAQAMEDPDGVVEEVVGEDDDAPPHLFPGAGNQDWIRVACEVVLYPDLSPEWLEEMQGQAVGSRVGAEVEETHFGRVQGKDVCVYTFAEIESTHKAACAYPLDRVGEGSVMVFRAETQGGGVGQNSNSWESPLGNLYITYLADAVPVIQSQFLPSLCVLETVTACLTDADPGGGEDRIELKWINDVFVDGKKIAGSLTVGAGSRGRRMTILSMGVNLNVPPPLDTAIALTQATGEEYDVAEFASRLTHSVCSHLDDAPDTIIAQMSASLRFQDQEVVVWSTDLKTQLYQGVFRGIDSYGFALLDIPGRGIVQVMEGRMRARME